MLSMMLAAATEPQRERMLALLPPEAIELWRTVGAPQLDDIHRRLTVWRHSGMPISPWAR